MVPTLTLCLCMLHRNTSRRVFGRYLASCRRIACPPMSCSTPSCRCVYHGAARAVSRWQEMGQILAPLHCSAQCWQRDSGVSFHFTRPKTEAGHELVSDRSYIWTRQWNSYRLSASPCFYWIQPGFVQLQLLVHFWFSSEARVPRWQWPGPPHWASQRLFSKSPKILQIQIHHIFPRLPAVENKLHVR